MLDWQPKAPYTAEQLLEILRILRDPENGCPWDKVQTHASIRKNFLEETCEVLEAIDADDPVLMQEELGDVLFSAVNVARFLDIDSEHALYDACDKFTDRFSKVECLANERGIDMKTASLSELDSLWDEVKILNKDN